MRAAIYARVSTKDKGQEVENQLTQLREFCRQQKWTITREYVDHESGGKDDRREFVELFADASRRRFEVVLFWALDRFSREGALPTLLHFQRLSSYNVAYKSFCEQYWDTCGLFKDALIAIIATLAKQEQVRISQRVKAGLELARARGVKLGRRRATPNLSLIEERRAAGASWRAIGREMRLSPVVCQRAAQDANKTPSKKDCATG